MPASVAVRAGTWLSTAHGNEVRRGNAQLRQNPNDSSASKSPNRNRFYALKKQEKSAYVVTGMLQVF